MDTVTNTYLQAGAMSWFPLDVDHWLLDSAPGKYVVRFSGDNLKSKSSSRKKRTDASYVPIANGFSCCSHAEQ
eukprot:scaffold604_cov119-Pinguiococcus_pyrenoidosus.AAC.1